MLSPLKNLNLAPSSVHKKVMIIAFGKECMYQKEKISTYECMVWWKKRFAVANFFFYRKCENIGKEFEIPWNRIFWHEKYYKSNANFFSIELLLLLWKVNHRSQVPTWICHFCDWHEKKKVEIKTPEKYSLKKCEKLFLHCLWFKTYTCDHLYVCKILKQFENWTSILSRG